MTIQEKLKEAIEKIRLNPLTGSISLKSVNDAVDSCAEIVREEAKNTAFSFRIYTDMEGWTTNGFANKKAMNFRGDLYYRIHPITKVLQSIKADDLYNLFQEEQAKQK